MDNSDMTNLGFNDGVTGVIDNTGDIAFGKYEGHDANSDSYQSK
jgi:hypothetical protein